MGIVSGSPISPAFSQRRGQVLLWPGGSLSACLHPNKMSLPPLPPNNNPPRRERRYIQRAFVLLGREAGAGLRHQRKRLCEGIV